MEPTLEIMGKGEEGRKSLYKEPHHQRPQPRLWTKKKFIALQGKTPLEMGTGGGGGGKRGGGRGKRPPEDKIEFENHFKKDDDEVDSSTETSFDLEVTPEQLATVNPNRPILRL